MRMRVEELALAGEVSVDTVRYYQKQGLLPPPERDGRLGWYDEAHLARLGRVKGLQRRGFSLGLIRRFLTGELDPADELLAVAVARAGDGDLDGDGGAGPAAVPAQAHAEAEAEPEAEPEAEALFALDELAERAGVPVPLLEMLVTEGILVPRRLHGRDCYTAADALAVAAGLRVLELGFPLADLIDLARRHDLATREFAARAVDLFDEHVRKPLREAALDDGERARRLVEAFDALLPAVTTMVSHHFRRTLLVVATDHLESVGEATAELAEARSG